MQNDFLTFACAPGANVLTQAAYAAASATATGYVSGTASSSAVNKSLRQTSIMSGMLAAFIAAQTGQDVIDDGTITTIEANFVTAIANVAGNRIIQISDVVGLTTALNGKLSTTGNAASASRLATARTITLGGIATGSGSFDGSTNITINTSIADGALSIAKTSGLQTALNGKQAVLGYTPVRQGGGSGQLTNTVYIGWSASGLKAQVDNTDLGPITLASQFTSLRATNGWRRTPDGMIEQWGSVGVAGKSTATFSFPIPFPNAALNIVASKGSSINLSGEGAVGADIASNSTFTVRNSSDFTSVLGIYWRAIGY